MNKTDKDERVNTVYIWRLQKIDLNKEKIEMDTTVERGNTLRVISTIVWGPRESA